MSGKKPRMCPICHHPGLINISQHLNGGQKRKQLIQGGMVGKEVMVTEKHISYLEMLQHGERLRIELMKKATQGELKAILELCLNMNEGNFSLPKRKSNCSVISTRANRDIPLSNKKKWMFTYNKMLYSIIHPAMNEWKRKFKQV